eukprot:Gb_08661 [translate_table: standard]
MHKDMKSGNIILFMDVDSVGNSKSNIFQIKLANFGLSNYCVAEAITNACMALEVWDKHKYNETTNVWSLGVILYALLSG